MSSPVSTLSKSKKRMISIRLKNGLEITGRLIDSDIYMNLLLEEARQKEGDEYTKRLGKLYVRGNMILFIKLSPKIN